MSRTLFSLAGFQVITIGRLWAIAEVVKRVPAQVHPRVRKTYPSI